MFLMVRNKGVADYRALTTLGISTTRYNQKNGTIGMFGSGTCHSICLLLRKNINPIFYTGNLKLEFFTKAEFISGKQFNQIYMKFSGKTDENVSKNNVEKLSMTTEWGEADWDKTSMAFRETISNAIDGSIAQGSSPQDVEIDIVEKPRAKAGYTSVYLPYCQEIQEAYRQLGTMFLHFKNPDQLNSKFLPKDPDSKVTMIYKHGVAVCHLNKKSVFNYNFGEELKLDESRNANRSDIETAAAGLIRDAEPQTLSTILRSIISNGGENLFENHLNSYYLSSLYDSKADKATRSKNFQTAFTDVFGDKACLCDTNILAPFIERKGYRPIIFSSQVWYDTLLNYEVPSSAGILSDIEQRCENEVDVSEEQIAAMKWAWNLVETFKMTNGKAFPQLKSYRSLRDGGSQENGRCDLTNGVIWLHADLGGTDLKRVALHELVHYATGSFDCSVDYQDYILRLITLIAA